MTLAEFEQVSKDILGAAHLETVTETVRQILPVSRDRQVLIFSPPSAGRVTVWPDVDTGIGGGFNINWNDSCFWLSGAKDGGIVKKRWFAIALLGDGPVTNRWEQTGVGVGTAAVALEPAVENRRHQLEGINGSFDAATAFATLDIRVNAGSVARQHFSDNSQAWNLKRAVEGAANQTMEGVLSAGAGGVFSTVNIWGVTIDAGDGGIDLGIIEGLTRPELVN